MAVNTSNVPSMQVARWFDGQSHPGGLYAGAQLRAPPFSFPAAQRTWYRLFYVLSNALDQKTKLSPLLQATQTGFCTRAHRMAARGALPPGISFYEVDLPEASRQKRELMSEVQQKVRCALRKDPTFATKPCMLSPFPRTCLKNSRSYARTISEFATLAPAFGISHAQINSCTVPSIAYIGADLSQVSLDKALLQPSPPSQASAPAGDQATAQSNGSPVPPPFDPKVRTLFTA
eukprot:1157721-Pelagomonas_calceolata.AAC.7